MKKFFVFTSVTIACIFVVCFLSLTVLTVTGKYVRYTDYVYNGKINKMPSEDFHFKYHLYGNKNYKTFAAHYEWHW